MIFLGIKTDSPDAELYLYDEDTLSAEYTWGANRTLARDLLSTIETFLDNNDTKLAELNGLFVYKGPGSFTGLRIGITVMNTLSYALAVPIIGSSGDRWHKDALERLQLGVTDEIVLPEYGANPRITKPKK